MGKNPPEKGTPDLVPSYSPRPPEPPLFIFSERKPLSLMKKLPDPPKREGPDFHAPSPPPPPIQDKPRRPRPPAPALQLPSPHLAEDGGRFGSVRSEPARSGLRAAHGPPALRREGPGGAAGARAAAPGPRRGVRGPGGRGARREGKRAAREGAGSWAGGEAGARREGESRGAGGRGAPRREAEPRTPGLGTSAEEAPVQAARTRGPSSCATSLELVSSLWL